MLELEEALSQVLAAMPAPLNEIIPLADAHRRILAERILSPIDLPVFDNSAMDGYAVRADDVASAKLEAPVRLRLMGQVAAGENFTGEVPPGACVRVFPRSALAARRGCGSHAGRHTH